ncbi:MAG: bifunctional pyr operon transcriptional regulator/uracil phosphoribosyltransferase PyrR [Candidatus Eremiobacteraeota bacterium]|nr:bifunctional pyr operon transcriptional regulator/uracil phosphoribosyltransferase PyrR [Candidatus Eremiobacteraeota bacterium]
MTGATVGRVIVRSAEVERIVARLAHQILEPCEAEQGLVLLGVRRGGEALATRLAAEIERISGRAPALGFLNINLYRDDRVSHELPESQIPGDISNRVIVIVDDVLYTGRTIRSALDAVTDLGRPAAIRLCVLVDRGLRELPIQPDFVGRFTPTTASERVKVTLSPKAAPADEITISESARADTP